MSNATQPGYIGSLAQLESLFGPVAEAPRRKEVSYLHPGYQAMIAASPFAVLATVSPEGLDASPRGDPPGFVAVQDEHTLLVPDRRGNNRIDSLRNIMADPRVALIFLIPGKGETLRVTGTARVSIAPDLLQRFAHQGALPKCVIEISVVSVFFQCARAILRSKLWSAPSGELLRNIPTPGAILASITSSEIDGPQYDDALATRTPSTLY
jgi:PPOX class probable FMN-dependent enzyme